MGGRRPAGGTVMTGQLWSWALAAVGITGLWLAAKKPKAGWTVALCAQALWLAYAVATRQWGFLATAVAYAVVYARLLRRARQVAVDPTEPTDAG
jgi:hypothetical protein